MERRVQRYEVRAAQPPGRFLLTHDVVLTGRGADMDLHTVHVGGAARTCVTIAVKPVAKTAVVGSVEYDAGCSLGAALARGEGTAGMLRAALWATRQLYPDLTRFELMDDSHIDCSGARMSLAAESVLKRRQTWYEGRIGAVIDPPAVHAAYRASLAALDAPLPPADGYVDRHAFLRPHRDVVAAATSLDDLLARLRTQLGDRYCTAVGPHLQALLLAHGVRLHPDMWVVHAAHLAEPPGFAMAPVPAAAGGGVRRPSQRQRPRTGRRLRVVSGGGGSVIGRLGDVAV